MLTVVQIKEEKTLVIEKKSKLIQLVAQFSDEKLKATFLFDKNTQPYVKGDEICKDINTISSTVSQKASVEKGSGSAIASYRNVENGQLFIISK